MEPMNYFGPPTYFNRDGSPSLAVRWAGAEASAVSEENGCVEIASQGRPFYVLAFVSDTANDREICFRRRTTTHCTESGPEVVAANTETEWGSVQTTSRVQTGTGLIGSTPTVTSSYYVFPTGTAAPLMVRFEVPLYVGPNGFFSAINVNDNQKFFLQFIFAEVVQS